MYLQNGEKRLGRLHPSPVIKRGCSSAGRAPALQAGGQEFDSPHLHHLLSIEKKKVSKENFKNAGKQDGSLGRR